ncbi:hypothetical protein Bca4012_027508 [Brassica carinata]
MGIPINATLRDIYDNGVWRLRPARSERQVTVQALLTSITLNSEPDTTSWIIDSMTWDKYSIAGIYNAIKNHGAKVPWKQIIRSKGGIPKHNFMCWLVTFNRLPTKDRQLSWSLSVDLKCLLCSAFPESRDHLLFDCSYSWSLWRPIALRLDMAPIRDWSSSLGDMQTLPGSEWLKRLRCLAWKLVIYSLWTERNSRLHHQNYRSVDSLALTLDRAIKNRIQSLRDQNPTVSSQMYQFWFR